MNFWMILGIVLICSIGTVGTAVHKLHECEKHKQCRVPRVGEKLHFWDDGKISDHRHFLAVVTHVLTPEETKKLCFDSSGISDALDEPCKSLIDAWEVNKKDANWIFAEETDYFIGCAIPEYDDHIIWFARTKDGGWFSMCLHSAWEGGRLDVSDKRYKESTKNGLVYTKRL